MESGAISLHLAERQGRLIPRDPARRLDALQWTMWQIGSFGPTLGHAHHFLTYHPGSATAAEARFARETRRLYDAPEARLTGQDFVADEHSIADIAIRPWVYRHERHGTDLSDYTVVRRWFEGLRKRPGYRRGSEAFDERLDADRNVRRPAAP